MDPLGLWVDVIEFDFKDSSRESIYIDKNYESILRAYEELITAQKSSKQDLDYENERRDKIQSTIIGGDNDYKELADLLTSEYARQYGNEVSLTEQAFEMCLQHAKTSSQFVENAKSVGEDVLDVAIPIAFAYGFYYLTYAIAGILVNQGSTKSMREQLLNSAQNEKLKNAINEIYRPGATIGDGGLADAVRHELSTGELVGGKSHIQKAMERVTNLENIIDKHSLNQNDLNIATKLLNDLKNALGGN